MPQIQSIYLNVSIEVHVSRQFKKKNDNIDLELYAEFEAANICTSHVP